MSRPKKKTIKQSHSTIRSSGSTKVSRRSEKSKTPSSKKRKEIKKTLSSKSSKRRMRFQAPKGTFDILPEDQKYWERIIEAVKELASAYGFLAIDTPMFEDTQLYTRGTGKFTDIVQKEMYTFRTKGGAHFALRPEFTPGIARAYIEHGMKSRPQPVKLYSIGPIFRHEKPQAGRFRQFNQFNLEIIGGAEAINDVLLIQLSSLILKKIGINNFTFQINSIGCPQCRPNYRKLLIDYYRKQRRKLCSQCRQRLKTNPFRLLDCKEEKCQQLASNAPQMIDHLCNECHNHFKEVLETLDELGISYILNPYLVRGLDYYTKTVFEIHTEKESYLGELGGGGRYDNLLELLGGGDIPAAGVAIGIERIISILKSEKIKIHQEISPKVFLAHVGELGKRRSLKLFEELRKKGLKTTEAFSKSSIKSQLATADRLGINLVLILGQKEALENNIIIRDMKSGVQETVPIDRIIKEVRKRLK
mgnify:CR=1 FL=1